jgi:hypothetical protein
LIVQALERAMTALDGLPLVAGKQTAGLFPSGAAGKDAARSAADSGLFRVLRTEAKGKSAVEYFTLTEKGLAHLLEQSSPRPVLSALLASIDGCQAKIDRWIADVAESRKSLDGLRSLAERVLTAIQEPRTSLPAWARNGHTHEPQARIVELLHAWRESGKIGDCPLPELYEQVRGSSKLTIGQFHDALRALHEQRAVSLHPWTGPMPELPQPAFSLLVGHEVAYYASLRGD